MWYSQSKDQLLFDLSAQFSCCLLDYRRKMAATDGNSAIRYMGDIPKDYMLQMNWSTK